MYDFIQHNWPHDDHAYINGAVPAAGASGGRGAASAVSAEKQHNCVDAPSRANHHSFRPSLPLQDRATSRPAWCTKCPSRRALRKTLRKTITHGSGGPCHMREGEREGEKRSTAPPLPPPYPYHQPTHPYPKTSQPDLLMLEFAVNDVDDPNAGAFEALVRKAVGRRRSPAVALAIVCYWCAGGARVGRGWGGGGGGCRGDCASRCEPVPRGCIMTRARGFVTIGRDSWSKMR